MPRDRCVLLLCLVFSFVLSSPAQTTIATVPVGYTPVALAVDTATNKIFAVNQDSNNVTVIDGLTDGTVVVPVGNVPVAAAFNPASNKIYVVNQADNTATIVDGATLATVTVRTGVSPQAIAVNPISNKIYVLNLAGTVTVIDGASNSTTAVAVGSRPSALAINPVTNKIYVANSGGGSMTVIDGTTNSTTSVLVGVFPCAVAVNPVINKVYIATANLRGTGTLNVIDGANNSIVAKVAVGVHPYAVGVNPATNKIYVSNADDGTVTVIDGTTYTPAILNVGSFPGPLAVDLVTNKVYVAMEAWSGAVTMIDGVDNSTTSVPVGASPAAVALHPAANRIYVANSEGGTVSIIAGANSGPLQFIPVTPCRVADTRNPNGPFGGPPINGGTSRDFIIPASACGVPKTAAAYSLNVTVVPGGPLGYLTVWPTGLDQPTVSTLNSLDGRVKANAAIVPAGVGGAISLFATNTTNMVLDINGYFAAVTRSTLAFYPLNPCRVVDTRGPNGPLGGPFLQGGGAGRDFPMTSSSCNIPASANAYSLNFTAVPRGPLGFLSTWPAGQNQPWVSTLNAPTGVPTANGAIVPAGSGGDIDVYVSNDSDVVIDINGYFAPPPGGLSLYPTAPCRVLDTRQTSGLFSGEIAVNVAGSLCGLDSAAQAFVLNATVVPQSWLGYLTLWPDGGVQPLVSTLNAFDGAITSNMAIVPTNNGWIDAFASNSTQLILDSSSYFGP